MVGCSWWGGAPNSRSQGRQTSCLNTRVAGVKPVVSLVDTLWCDVTAFCGSSSTVLIYHSTTPSCCRCMSCSPPVHLLLHLSLLPWELVFCPLPSRLHCSACSCHDTIVREKTKILTFQREEPHTLKDLD
jgi:hypothetical protein